LLEKAYEGNFRVVVKTKDDSTAERLSGLLWTYDPNSFLPHGRKEDGNEASQPIYLTAENDNPNHANLLAVTDGSTPENMDGFERVLDLFDGQDEAMVKAARTRWKAYKDAGHELQYWQQTESGGWEKKA
ncbi:MAG: DNA polymerase III subunit chi, partial [Rickettsiales bacterium]